MMVRMRIATGCAAAGLAALLSAASVPVPAAAAGLPLAGSASTTAPAPAAPANRPLAGLVIALDPGHQLGNANPAFARQMGQTRFNGVVTRGCNTTGTATSAGYPEATFTWNVATRLKHRLERQGAAVHLTRTSNAYDQWGPCVWSRGRFGAKVGADLLVSIHADGAPASGRGFFIVTPARVPGWTDDIAAPSARMGARMRDALVAAGATTSTYISGGLTTWDYLSTLNFADVPALLIELGNMRNPDEGRAMATAEGQARYARWLVAGIRAALRR